MKDLFLDSGVFIRHFRERPREDSLLSKLGRQDCDLYCSTVAYYEVLVGATALGLKATEALFTSVTLVAVDPSIARIGAAIGRTLRQTNKRIAAPDTLIAATAIHYGLQLATFDAKHMPRVPGLNLFDPAQLA